MIYVLQRTEDNQSSLVLIRLGCSCVSTVRHADRIYVIENGSVAEEGNHSELLALGRYYADLHQKQMLEDELEAI